MINTNELLPPTLNGNTMVLNFLHRHTVLDFALQAELNQFSVIELQNGSFSLSTPLTEDFEEKYLGMVHGARARAQDKPDPKPPTGGGNPDGTPPGGGTPGTPVLDKYTFTEARAA